VLLVGLDTRPQEALAAIRRIIALRPACGIIVFGQESVRAHAVEAMAAGARRYVPYPFDAAAIEAAIRDVHVEVQALSAEVDPFASTVSPGLPRIATAADNGTESGKVVSVFSPKGGVGTTTLAVNLAGALRAQGERVALVDGNASFGNVGMFLNLEPSTNMLQVIDGLSQTHTTSVDEALITHPSGLSVLLAPPRPEDGERITGDHVDAVLTRLRATYDYVVVDTCPSYDDRVLTMLERADHILVPTGPELSSIKNVGAFLRVVQSLKWPEDKVVLVLMRADSVPASHIYGLEGALGRPLTWRVVSDGKRATAAINNGEPFVWADPDAGMSRTIIQLAHWLLGKDVAPSMPEQRRQPLWRRGRLGLGTTV
jgi:pilus assembly protein CpaE